VVLANGEFGVEVKPDGNVFVKVGNGTTPWPALTYITAEPQLSSANPSDLGATASPGNSEFASPADHVHKLPTPGEIGSPTNSSFDSLSQTVSSQGQTIISQGQTITAQGTSIANNAQDIAELIARLNAFRDARKIYTSPSGNNANDGTSPGEPLQTLAAAAAASQPGDLIVVGPGVYNEILPIRWKRDVGILAGGLRNTTVKPAAGQEMNDVFKVDSGFWCWGLEFAGHQADTVNGQQSWAISFDELADNTAIGAIGLGAYILKSPYIQNCSSITAEDDAGNAGSVSTGDTGGGILVDGTKCAKNSPIRSMVVDSYTQVNLGGPGCLVINDGYAQLVSFFGTFCEYHVRTESGGQVNLSGGGTSDFGTYGLMADGYSPSPLFVGGARVAAYGAARLDKAVTIDDSTDVFTSNSHGLVLNDQITIGVSDGTLPSPLQNGTTYFVIEPTANTFKVSLTEGGAAVNITEPATGTYNFVRQGSTQVDVIGFTANRLGRQIKYPTQGSLGSSTNPSSIVAVSGSSFTVQVGAKTVGTLDILHEYVGGGTVTVGGQTYPVETASYNYASGLVQLTAAGYTPQLNATISLEGLSFICNSVSRPNSGMLMFPQLIFPRNSTTEVPEAKTFAYTRIGTNTLTYQEAASPSGPDHEYVSGGTIIIGGVDYGVVDAVYSKATGVVTITTVTPVPAESGDVTVEGLKFICPTSAYIVTSSIPIDANGVEVANNSPNRAGYRVLFFSGVNGGLKNPITVGQGLDFRNRSQVSAPSHTFEFVGSGTNYNALPWNGGVPVPANKIVETNNGRVYSSNTDELGNFKVGTQFEVDGTTGSVTINTDQFNLSGLNFIGPFSRNGGISTVGEQLREVSNNVNLIASTGAADGNTAPTQFAVKTYTGERYVTNVTATAGQPISVSVNAAGEQDQFGEWSYVKNISLSLNTANGLARLDGSGLIPASLLPSYVDDVLEYANLAAFPDPGEVGKIYVDLSNNKTYRWSGSTYIEVSPSPGSTDSLPEGSVNLYFTNARARAAVSASGLLSYDPNTGVFGYTLGANVLTTDGTQSVSNKTFVNYKETVFTVTHAANVSLNPANGPIQVWNMTTNSTVLFSAFQDGQTMTLMVDDGLSNTITWPTVSWINGSAPTLEPTGYTVLEFWRVAGTVYGAKVGGAYQANQSAATTVPEVDDLVTVNAVSDVYTLDIAEANDFAAGAAIAADTTINLSNLNLLQSGRIWRGSFRFTYTSGAISWFTGNTGYTVTWYGVNPPTLTAGQSVAIDLLFIGGTTSIVASPAGGSGIPGGSNTSVQFNDGGAFGGVSDLTYDKTTKVLKNAGDINLDDGGTYTTTLQMVTPTADRVISFPDRTGTVALVAGSNGQLTYNSAGAQAGLPNSSVDGSTGAVTLARLILAANGAANVSPLTLNGTWFTGGTTANNYPAFLLSPLGATLPSLNTAGTGALINAPSGFTGTLAWLGINGVRSIEVLSSGALNVGLNLPFEVQTNGTKRIHVTPDGLRGYTQGTQVAINGSATLSPGNLKAGIITSTTAATVDLTLPPAANFAIDNPTAYDNFTFEWSIINTGNHSVNLLVNTGHTIIGSASVDQASSGRFATRRVDASTYITYRLS
jgi:hypothetical protein